MAPVSESCQGRYCLLDFHEKDAAVPFELLSVPRIQRYLCDAPSAQGTRKKARTTRFAPYLAVTFFHPSASYPPLSLGELRGARYESLRGNKILTRRQVVASFVLLPSPLLHILLLRGRQRQGVHDVDEIRHQRFWGAIHPVSIRGPSFIFRRGWRLALPFELQRRQSDESSSVKLETALISSKLEDKSGSCEVRGHRIEANCSRVPKEPVKLLCVDYQTN